MEITRRNALRAEDVAERLTLIRKAYGLGQQDFGERAGLSQPQYNQFETARRLLTLPAALRLCDEYNVTLDYLYRGEPSNLPRDLWLQIRILSKS